MSHLLVAVGDVADLIPREGALGCQPVVRLVDVQTQGVHSQKKICSLFILKHIQQSKQSFSSTRLLRDTSEQSWDHPYSQHLFLLAFDIVSLWWLCLPKLFVRVELNNASCGVYIRSLGSFK